jgi:Ni/Co efflux regulator RcnB
MKAKGKGSPGIPPASINEAIVSTWRRMGFTSVGKQELLAIQQALGEELSPASIARQLAAADAELRHPEIIECDAEWRERQIANRDRTLADLRPLTLNDAEKAISTFEALRLRAIDEQDEMKLRDLRELAIEARRNALNRVSQDPSQRREEQAEIAEWLRVWLETPEICAHWIELRKASAAFKNKFAVY